MFSGCEYLISFSDLVQSINPTITDMSAEQYFTSFSLTDKSNLNTSNSPDINKDSEQKVFPTTNSSINKEEISNSDNKSSNVFPENNPLSFLINSNVEYMNEMFSINT